MLDLTLGSGNDISGGEIPYIVTKIDRRPDGTTAVRLIEPATRDEIIVVEGSGFRVVVKDSIATLVTPGGITRGPVDLIIPGWSDGRPGFGSLQGLSFSQGPGDLPTVGGPAVAPGGGSSGSGNGGGDGFSDSPLAPTTYSMRPISRPGYSANGYDFWDTGRNGDVSDDYWIIDGEKVKYGRLGRTVAEEKGAWENWDWVFGTNRADDFPGATSGSNGGKDSSKRDRSDKDSSKGGEKNIVERVTDWAKDKIQKIKDWATGNAPIIFDLDDVGIQITELSNSTTFMDDGDGLLHRTAWAGAGNAVLFYDPDNLGAIVEKRQYVFTEWDPTATSDMAAEFRLAA